MKNNYTYSRLVSRRLLLVLIPALVVIGGCKDIDDYYELPEGLEGPLFEQLQSVPEFSEFVVAIEKLPLIKRAINTSGLYTVFAPTNTAIQEYLTTIPGKTKIADFDMSNTEDAQFIQDFVDKHIILNMYFEYNFTEFIDEKEDVIVSRFNFSNDIYRFWSRYREPKYWFKDKEKNLDRLVRPGNHVVSVYTSEYITKYKMTDDYQNIFGVAPGNFNIEGSQVIEDLRDIAAKNGVIHGVNKVIQIAPFIENILEEKNPFYRNLLDNFARLDFNLAQSLAESEDQDNIDSIFFKRYEGFFNFSSDEDVATILCPAIGTFDVFVNNEVLPGFYNTFDSVPDYTSNLLLNEYVVAGRVWESDLQSGVINYNLDTVQDPTISEKIIASNGIVYVIEDLLLSPAFNSIAKPVLVNKEYSWLLEMLEQIFIGDGDFIRYMQNQYRDFTFLIPTNDALDDFGVERIKDPRGDHYFRYKGRKMLTKKIDSLLSSLLIQDIALAPGEINDLKFYPTRLGHYVGFENGSIVAEDGNDGLISLANNKEQNNGYSYLLSEVPPRPETNLKSSINRFAANASYMQIINAPDSISKSDDGASLKSLLETNSPGTSYTVFVPTEQALLDYQTAQGLGAFETDTAWAQVIQNLIVKTRVYTEGTYEEKVDNPLPNDPSRFVTLYKKVIYDEDNLFSEDEYSTLKLTFPGGGAMQVESEGGEVANVVASYNVEAISGVIHHIDKVLVPPVKTYPDSTE